MELKKFSVEHIETERQRWLQFFIKGEQLDEAAMPDWMNTDEMRQAMGTLKLFSEKERNYHEYQSRQNYLREQRTILWELEQERQQKQHALQQVRELRQREQAALLQAQESSQREQAASQREQAASQREQAAQAEIEKLKALLAQK